MVTDKIKELQATRAKLAELESSVGDELKKELASLPGHYGFESVAALQGDCVPSATNVHSLLLLSE